MATISAVELVNNQEWLDQASEAIQPLITDAFKAGGDFGQQLKDLLHGTWLGHPLHPVLTNIPLGAWSAALALDAMEAISGRKEFRAGADAAIAVGLVGALASAITGATDWSGTYGRGRKIGLAHALLNVGGTALYTTSLLLRRKKSTRQSGLGFAMLGYVVAGAAAYLGGHLVYNEQIGVDHTAAQEMPHEFVSVIAEADLPENKLTRAEAQGVPVLLLKKSGRIYAIAETCSHLGGPLAEGELQDGVVQCPWHGSRFSLEDGKVVNGPATAPQPCFETRIVNGQVEVRTFER